MTNDSLTINNGSNLNQITSSGFLNSQPNGINSITSSINPTGYSSSIIDGTLTTIDSIILDTTHPSMLVQNVNGTITTTSQVDNTGFTTASITTVLTPVVDGTVHISNGNGRTSEVEIVVQKINGGTTTLNTITSFNNVMTNSNVTGSSTTDISGFKTLSGTTNNSIQLDNGLGTISSNTFPTIELISKYNAVDNIPTTCVITNLGTELNHTSFTAPLNAQYNISTMTISDINNTNGQSSSSITLTDNTNSRTNQLEPNMVIMSDGSKNITIDSGNGNLGTVGIELSHTIDITKLNLTGFSTESGVHHNKIEINNGQSIEPIITLTSDYGDIGTTDTICTLTNKSLDFAYGSMIAPANSQYAIGGINIQELYNQNLQSSHLIKLTNNAVALNTLTNNISYQNSIIADPNFSNTTTSSSNTILSNSDINQVQTTAIDYTGLGSFNTGIVNNSLTLSNFAGSSQPELRMDSDLVTAVGTSVLDNVRLLFEAPATDGYTTTLIRNGITVTNGIATSVNINALQSVWSNTSAPTLPIVKISPSLIESRAQATGVFSWMTPTALLVSDGSNITDINLSGLHATTSLAISSGDTITMTFGGGKTLVLTGLPTSASGLASGSVWRNGTVLNIV